MQKSTTTTTSKTLALITVKRHKSNVLELHGQLHPEMKAYLLSLPGVCTCPKSQILKMLDSKGQIGALLSHIKGRGIWVDLRSLQRQRAPATLIKAKKRNALHIPLAPEVLERISDFRRYLEQKRYARSTIATYLGMLRSFFAKTAGKKWDQINGEDIIAYNHSEIVQRGLARSTQNQLTSALKLFYTLHDQAEIVPDAIERPRKERRLPMVLSKKEIAAMIRTTSNQKHRCLLTLIY